MPSAPDPARPRYRYVVLVLAFCAVMASIGFTRFAYTVIMPEMRQSLGLAYTEMGTIGSVGFAVYMLANVPAGLAAARFGMKRTMACALALTSVGLFGLATAHGFTASVLASVVVQAGSAGANVAAFAILTPWFPVHQRGRAMGIAMGGAGAGITLIGFLVPLLMTMSSAGWRAGWAAIGGITLLLAIVCAVALRDHPAARRPGPVEWRSMLTTPAVSASCVLVLLFGFEYIVFGTFFAAHLRAGGRTAAEAGHLWSAVGILMMASGLVGGALSDRIGRFAALAAVMGAQALASFALASTVAGPGLWAAIVLYGATVMGFPAILSAIAGDVVGPARASAFIAIVNVCFGLGQTIGPLAAGAIIDATGSVRTAFLLGAVVSLVAAAGAVAAAALVPPRRNAPIPGG